ncbi:unnamed protein product [Toxocara canis]|uniref:Reticulocyte-binding protein 2-like protein a n=1 Tax=Toxocara canis TaxID=6265 RepID=A0A183UHV2_TOXCA|nr:unnamed protein product [Toxocara canis]
MTSSIRRYTPPSKPGEWTVARLAWQVLADSQVFFAVDSHRAGWANFIIRVTGIIGNGGPVTHERISQPIFNPKLTPGQKIILAREAEERERLLAEKAAREKAEREREERERERQKKLQEAREREEAENRKRDEEAIKKWEMEEAERRQLLEEKLEADRLEEERKRQEEIAAEQRRLEEQQREEEKRLEAEQEEQKRRERELELMRLQEAEQKRQEEIDDLLGSLSPLDSIEETKSLGELKEDSLERRQQQQQRRTFSAIEQAMSHESLHDPSTPSSCAYTALIEASTPATASPQSVHSIPASPLQSSTRSPMQAIPSSPSPYNRIQYSPAGASSFQRYSTYQQQQLSTAQNLQQSPSQPNAHQGHQQMAQTWNQISSGQQDSFSNVMGGQTQIQQGMTMSHSQSNIQPSVIGVSRQAATTTGANIRQSDMLAQVQYGQLQQQQKQQMRQQLLQPQPQVVPQTPSQPLYQQPATQAFASQPADTGMNLQQAQPYGQQQQQTNFVGVGSYGNTRTAFQRTQSYEQASDIQTNVVASTHQQANVPSLMNSGVGSMIQHQQQQQQNVTSVSQTDMRPMQARTSAFLPATANPYMPAQQFVGNQQSQIYSQQQRQLVNQPHDQQHYMNYQQQQRQQQHYNNSQPWG